MRASSPGDGEDADMMMISPPNCPRNSPGGVVGQRLFNDTNDSLTSLSSPPPPSPRRVSRRDELNDRTMGNPFVVAATAVAPRHAQPPLQQQPILEEGDSHRSNHKRNSEMMMSEDETELKLESSPSSVEESASSPPSVSNRTTTTTNQRRLFSPSAAAAVGAAAAPLSSLLPPSASSAAGGVSAATRTTTTPGKNQAPPPGTTRKRLGSTHKRTVAGREDVDMRDDDEHIHNDDVDDEESATDIDEGGDNDDASFFNSPEISPEQPQSHHHQQGERRAVVGAKVRRLNLDCCVDEQDNGDHRHRGVARRTGGGMATKALAATASAKASVTAVGRIDEHAPSLFGSGGGDGVGSRTASFVNPRSSFLLRAIHSEGSDHYLNSESCQSLSSLQSSQSSPAAKSSSSSQSSRPNNLQPPPPTTLKKAKKPAARRGRSNKPNLSVDCRVNDNLKSALFGCEEEEDRISPTDVTQFPDITMGGAGGGVDDDYDDDELPQRAGLLRLRRNGALFSSITSLESGDALRTSTDGAAAAAPPTPHKKPSKTPRRLVQRRRSPAAHRRRAAFFGSDGGRSESRSRSCDYDYDSYDDEDGSDEYRRSQPSSRFESDFDVVATLGDGSFGTVYKVQSRLDKSMYAVKAAKREARGVAERNRMLKEVYALAALSDKADTAAFHIVRYHQAWMEGNRLYIQTELCGSTLVMEMSRGILDEKRRYKLLREMLLALDLIHRNDMVHLDIKPENIFIKNDQYKLGDFGLVSKATSQNDVEEGDSRYMSMELLSGDHDDLTKSDIFSLGATMYEACLGRLLPAHGQEWQDMRAGKLSPMQRTSHDLQSTIRDMMHPEYRQRPTASSLLKRRQLLSETEKQLILERNRATEANMALKAEQLRFKKLSPPRNKLLTRYNTFG